MKVIERGRSLILQALGAATLALTNSSGCSPGAVENNYVCDKTGCHQVASSTNRPNSPSSVPSSSSSSSIPLETALTNAAGETSVLGQQITATDDQQQPLANINIYGIRNGQESLYLAIDPSGKHYPAITSDHYGTLESHLTSTHYATKQSALKTNNLLNLVLDTVTYSKKIIATLTSAERGNILAQEKDTNLYCMTLEQMNISYVFVPAGIIFLATPEGIAGKTVKIADTTVLNEVFDTFIRTMYGDQEGYLVAVPKTAINLCGENYDSTVCPITTDILSQTLWSKESIPVWEVRGSCTPTKKSGNESIYVPNSGVEWQKNASSSRMNFPEAQKFCTALDDDKKSNWRLPYRNELESMISGSNDCLLPEALHGTCDWYWTNDKSCSSAAKPLLQVNFADGKSQCVGEAATAYVFCVREL